MAPYADRILYVIVLILSLSVHEWAHAISAFKLGDDTAQRQGRLTLNPLVHIDPLGTLLLPMLGLPLGWAKPVPYNPARFRRDITMRTGAMLTAAAGPLSNVVLALVSVVTLGLCLRFNPVFDVEQPALYMFLATMVLINAVLAVFNMLPVPPLDGSTVLDRFVPLRLRGPWESFRRYGPIVLLAIIFLPRLLQDISPTLAAFNPLRPTIGFLTNWLFAHILPAIAFG